MRSKLENRKPKIHLKSGGKNLLDVFFERAVEFLVEI